MVRKILLRKPMYTGLRGCCSAGYIPSGYGDLSRLGLCITSMVVKRVRFPSIHSPKPLRPTVSWKFDYNGFDYNLTPINETLFDYNLGTLSIPMRTSKRTSILKRMKTNFWQHMHKYSFVILSCGCCCCLLLLWYESDYCCKIVGSLAFQTNK